MMLFLSVCCFWLRFDCTMVRVCGLYIILIWGTCSHVADSVNCLAVSIFLMFTKGT